MKIIEVWLFFLFYWGHHWVSWRRPRKNFMKTRMQDFPVVVEYSSLLSPLTSPRMSTTLKISFTIIKLAYWSNASCVPLSLRLVLNQSITFFLIPNWSFKSYDISIVTFFYSTISKCVYVIVKLSLDKLKSRKNNFID